VLEADPRWYELLDPSRWRDQSWRDPWLFREPGDDGFHVLITARSRSAVPDGAGVIARARSDDLTEWEVLPPLTPAGEFAQVEVPQLIRTDGRCDLLVSCLAEDHSRQRRQRLATRGQTGTFAFTGASSFGPYTAADEPLTPIDGTLGPLYAGRLIEVEPGSWSFMAFRGDGDRSFVGELTDPLPVRFGEDGAIVVGSAYAGGPAQRQP
jgi:beta-fructofuranosidase